VTSRRAYTLHNTSTRRDKFAMDFNYEGFDWDLTQPYQPTLEDVYGPYAGLPAPVAPQYAVPYFGYPPAHLAPPRMPLISLPPRSNVPAAKGKAKARPKSPKKGGRAGFTARDLMDILMTGIEVEFYTAKHGEKGAKEHEFGTAIRKLGIQGSDQVFKTRLNELLIFHEVRLLFIVFRHHANCPRTPQARQMRSGKLSRAPIGRFRSGRRWTSSLRSAVCMMTRRTQRRSIRKRCVEIDTFRMWLTALQKASEDKLGGTAIRNASLNTSRSAAAAARVHDDDSGDDDLEIIDNIRAPAATPAPPMRALPVLSRQWSPPAAVLDSAHDSGTDSDIEIVGHTLPTVLSSVPDRVVIKREPTASTIPASAKESTAKKVAKTSTPLRSIPGSSRKSTMKKRVKHEDSDGENSPPPRKTKRVRANASFNHEAFLLVEREDRKAFQEKMLSRMDQGNIEFKKATDNTSAFQNEFLDVLRGVFK
jgi:hypothetical protein